VGENRVHQFSPSLFRIFFNPPTLVSSSFTWYMICGTVWLGMWRLLSIEKEEDDEKSSFYTMLHSILVDRW